MTQKYRWLASLALLLAFGAGAVRAEEEEEEVARPHSVVELPKMAVMPTAMPSPVFPLLFAPPCPCPCPMPIPTGMYGLPSAPVCLPYPCPTGACSAQCRGSLQTEDAARFVVTAKMVKGDDEDAEVTMCPRVSVFEGEPATIHLQGYQTPQGQASLQMLMSVTKQGKGARLALAVTEASADDGDESHLRSHTETTQVQCNVPFGKPYKMELKKDPDGSVGAWMEVTVTEVEREERVHQAACGGDSGGACPASMARAAEDTDATPLDTVGEVVDCLYDILSDTATSAFGWAIGADEDEEEAPQAYLQAPPQYAPPSPAGLRESINQETRPCSVCGSACPKAEYGCVQCAAVAAAKKPTLHIRIDAKHSRTCVEVNRGGKCWKASADQVTVSNGHLILEGDVHGESDDGSTQFTADKIVRDLDGLEIQIGD